NHLGRVAEVLIRAESEECAAAVGPQMKLRQKRGQLALGGEAIDLVKVRSERVGAKLLNRGFIHAGGEVVPDFLLVRVAAGSVPGQIIQNPPQESLVILSELAVNAPAGLVGGNRIFLHPPATTVLVEINAGVGVLIHEFSVESRSVGHRRNRNVGRRGGIRGCLIAGLRFCVGCGPIRRFSLAQRRSRESNYQERKEGAHFLFQSGSRASVIRGSAWDQLFGLSLLRVWSTARARIIDN